MGELTHGFQRMNRMTNLLNNKKRVAVVSAVYPPYRGGIGVLAQLDAEQIGTLGYDVDVYAPGQMGFRPWFRYGNAACAPGLFWLARRYDVVVLEYPFFGGAEFVALGRRVFGGTLILSYHMDVVGRGVLRRFFAWHRRWVFPFVCVSADKVLVTSGDYARESFLADHVVAPVVLSPSVDTEFFSPQKKARGTEKTIVFVGGLDRAHYFKGLLVVLQAMCVPHVSILTDAKLIVVGDGDCRVEFESFVRAHGLGERVRFAGNVAYKDLPAYYCMADVCVFPSVDRSEAFGLVALEAMACGVPVVASNLAGVRTIVRDGVTGALVAAGSSSALAETLATLLGDDVQLERMSVAARRMVEEEYSSANRIQQWKRIFDTV